MLDAFIAAGYLRPEDTTAEVIERPVSELGDEELLAEIRRRMKGARRGVASETEPDAPPSEDKDQEARRHRLVIVVRSGPDAGRVRVVTREEFEAIPAELEHDILLGAPPEMDDAAAIAAGEAIVRTKGNKAVDGLNREFGGASEQGQDAG